MTETPPKKNQDKRSLWSKYGRIPFPPQPRAREVVGGGFIIVERDIQSGRLRPAPWPFEHSTLKEAVDQAAALQNLRPTSAFSVFQERGCTMQMEYGGSGN